MAFETSNSTKFEKIVSPWNKYLNWFYWIVEYNKWDRSFKITQFDKEKKPHKIFLKYEHLIILNNIVKEVK